ncbi:hypothetical protein IFM89_006446 [Coptis chinensis]|uniref:Auxin-responsive protein n=1 Tax=Coptis chinensis TaxID=261450 RepID=A0A835HUF8_9MAGN|nr:hypothetical protein IFM89_006446 [Coptis chinensis]
MSGLSLGVAKNFGTKRGFSDAIDGNGKWSGLDGDLSKGGVLFSPRAGNNAGGKSLGVLENNNNITQVTSSDVVVVSATVQEKKSQLVSARDRSPPSKAQVVGWPPIRSFRKNTMAANPAKNSGDAEGKSGQGVSALEKMFSCFTIGRTDGDWMLVGDVPWDMFTDSCRRLRIMKGSEAIGLAPRAMEKCKSRN